MAHVLRVALALVLLSVSLMAQALIPPVPQISGQWGWGLPSPAATGASASDVCAALLPAFITQYTASGVSGFTVVVGQVPTPTASGYCQGSYMHPDGSPRYPARATLYMNSGNVCPTNSSLISSSGMCSCNANYEDSPDGKSCVPSKSRWEKACEANAGKRYNFQSSGKNQPGGCQTEINNVNSPIEGDTGGLPDSFGCQVRFVDDGSKTSALDPDTKEWVTKGLGRVTGETCVGTGVPVPGDAPEGTTQESEGKNDQCPYGLVKGVNGQIVCAYSDPNGTIEGTETSTVKNPDGTSTDTKKEIKCDGGVCTTTTTTTTRDSAGTIVGTKIDEKKESIGETCNKDPGNKVCATTGGGGADGGAGFSGSCEAGFTVKGEDPILNAMALEQYKRNCQFFEKKPDPTDETKAYDAMVAKGKQGGDQTGDLPDGSKRTINMNPSDFEGQDVIGVSACIADKTVTVMGQTVRIPFSVICPWLEYMGIVLLACSYFVAGRIVVKG